MKDPDPLPNDKLRIGPAKEGERSAFDQFIMLHQKQFIAYARALARSREDGDDIFTAAVMDFLRYCDRIDIHKSKALMMTIIKNKAIDHGRVEGTRQRHEVPLDPASHPISSPMSSADESLSFKQSLERARNGIRPKDRALLSLLEDNKSSKEIAEVLGTSVIAANVRVYRLRKKLEKFFQYGED